MENSYKIVAYRCPRDNGTVTYGQIGIGMTGKWVISADADKQNTKYY